MNRLERMEICDCTLQEAAGHFELSFREKIQLCRLIDRLGVSAIELTPIRQPKIDRLLVRSVSSAVQSAALVLPVTLGDEASVAFAWEALKEARSPRLQVACPVSSVQMEYLLHKKAAQALREAVETVAACRKFTSDVEFVAEDATRSDPAFLRQILAAVIEAGAHRVTLCDTAGGMMPEEVSALLQGLFEDVAGLRDTVVGFYSSGELNMADASAFAAIRAGARAIRAISCRGKAVSLANISHILDLKGAAVGVLSPLAGEQLHRICGQVDAICHTAGVKAGAWEEETVADGDLLLGAHETPESVFRAAEKLGYDLGAEDQQKVWKRFLQTVERKKSLTLRELDAIIAAEAMQAPPAYENIRYVINTGNQIGAMAHLKLTCRGQELEGIATGDGAIDAAFNSIEKATGRHYELDEFRIQAVTEGREAMGETVVRLRWEGKLYSGRGISTDIVGAGIMAYINAVNKIVYEEDDA